MSSIQAATGDSGERSTRRPRRRAVALIAAALLVAAGAAVFIISGSALRVEGGVQITGGATDSTPLIAGLTELHNDAPWTISITSITSPDSAIGYSLTPVPDGGGLIEPGPMVEPGDAVELAPGASLYLWLALTTDGDAPAAVTSIDIAYSSLFGLPHSEHSDALSVLAYPGDLPPGVASIDASEAAALDYIAVLRDALAHSDYTALAEVLGADATADDAQAFSREQEGVSAVTGFTASGEAPEWTASFASNLPDFVVVWENFRWSVRS